MEVRCPSCQAMLALADSAAGKRALCPACSTEFRAPAAGSQPTPRSSQDVMPPLGSASESMIRCPACDQGLAFAPEIAGQTIICPTCQRRLRMPTAGGQIVDLGTAGTPEPAASRRASTGRAAAWPVTAPARPAAGYDPNPYAAGADLPTSTLRPPEVRPLYAAPAIFLLLLSAPALFMTGIYLIGLMFGGIAGRQGGVAEIIVGLVFLSLAGLSHTATFIGAMQMIRRRRLDLARLGAWAALYPCGFCFVLQIPFAIWALVLLNSRSAAADFASPANPERFGGELGNSPQRRLP